MGAMLLIVVIVWVNEGLFIANQQSNEPRDDSGVDNFLNLVVRTISEFWQSHASDGKNVLFVAADKVDQAGKKLSDCRDTEWRIYMSLHKLDKVQVTLHNNPV